MSKIDDSTLLKMAEAEILGEAKRAAVRHSTMGISGWKPCPKTNKLFLTNAILQTVISNNIFLRKQEKMHLGKSKILKKEKERKFLQTKDKKSNYVYKKPPKNNQNFQLQNSKSSHKKKLESYKKNMKKYNEVKSEYLPKRVKEK